MSVRKDPTLCELFASLTTAENVNKFLTDNSLLDKPAPLGFTRKGVPFVGYCCKKPFNPSKPTCPGYIIEYVRQGLPKYACTVCKNQKSAHNGPSCYDPAYTNTSVSFFNVKDKLGRPNRKINPREALFIAFCQAYDIPASKLNVLTGTTLGTHALTDWGNYIRETMLDELKEAPLMGGVGDIIELDETYLKGRRKANRGRYLTGNRVGHQGHSRNNYLARSRGPWIFGMICRRTKEVRAFWVSDRSALTLLPIIRDNIAKGSLIYTDEWGGYNNLDRYGYHHESVNHSQNFVDPTSKAHTQHIERQWRKLKLPILKMGPGVAPSTINSHLAKFWWLSINSRLVCNDPFMRIVDLLARHFTP